MDLFARACALSTYRAGRGSGSQKVPYVLVNGKNLGAHFSITRDEGSENSSDLERAAAARSIAVEFSECTILVIEIVSLLCLKPPKRCCTFWDPESEGLPGARKTENAAGVCMAIYLQGGCIGMYSV